jgi:gamma-tubulin complex component 3
VDSNRSNCNSLVVQSFCSAIEEELLEYYKLIAVLESQIKSSISTSNPLSLRRLLVWNIDPLQRLKSISSLIFSVAGTKGGQFLSIINSHLSHGDPLLRSFVSTLLVKICVPLFSMIKSWIFDGLIVDPYQEFFVLVDTQKPLDLLWSKKYTLSESMLPSFISISLAKKVTPSFVTIN